MKRVEAVGWNALLTVLVAQSLCAGGRPVLENGAIVITTGAERREIRIGKRCADLWVAPDASIIAFIAVEKEIPPSGNEVAPFIEHSSLFVARQADGFKAVRIVLNSPVIDGRRWDVVRSPSVAPDRGTIYFMFPYTMTSWNLRRVPLAGGASETVTDVVGYCVIWGGDRPGELLLQIRRVANPRDAAPGVSYPCYVRNTSGKQQRVASEHECWVFDKFAAEWGTAHGGSCRPGSQD